MDGARKTGAEEAPSPKGKGERERPRQEEEEMAGAPRGLLRGGKSREQQEDRLSKEWEDAKRWSKMDQLAKELTAEKRLEGEDEEDDPDHSMKQSFQARGYGFRGPGLQLHRGWRPSSREDTVEPGLALQVHSYPEEKKEEEGSANRRPEVGTGRKPALGQALGAWAPLRGSCTQTCGCCRSEWTCPLGVWDWRGVDGELSETPRGLGSGKTWKGAGKGRARQEGK